MNLFQCIYINPAINANLKLRYFLTSIVPDAEKFANAVRKHWGIESMHWSLDTTFNEDSRRVRKDNAPENLAILLKFAYNYIKNETTVKKSLGKNGSERR